MPTDVIWAEAVPATPHRTLTLDSVAALRSQVDHAREQRAKVLLLTGGTDTWCVGGDIAAFGDPAHRATYIDELADRLHHLVLALHALDAIVVTVIDGVTAGAGTPLAAAGDIVLASERACFTLGYTKLGLTPDGGTTMLSASLGLHRTLYSALTNPVVSAQDAHRQGLVAEVLPPADLHTRAHELATQLATSPRDVLAATKSLVRRQAVPQVSEALERERSTLLRAATSPAAAEGIQAFLNKRPPDFGE